MTKDKMPYGFADQAVKKIEKMLKEPDRTERAARVARMLEAMQETANGQRALAELVTRAGFGDHLEIVIPGLGRAMTVDFKVGYASAHNDTKVEARVVDVLAGGEDVAEISLSPDSFMGLGFFYVGEDDAGWMAGMWETDEAVAYAIIHDCANHCEVKAEAIEAGTTLEDGTFFPLGEEEIVAKAWKYTDQDTLCWRDTVYRRPASV